MAPISVTLAGREPLTAVVALVGEHDAYTSDRLQNELNVLIDDGRRIAVDLREASFIDSTTLSVLLAGKTEAEERSLGFALVLAEDEYTPVNQILDLTGLGPSFAIFGKLEDALRELREPRNIHAA
jgi:anti-anti-sigma factor